MLKEYHTFNIEKRGEYYLEQTHLTLERAQTNVYECSINKGVINIH